MRTLCAAALAALPLLGLAAETEPAAANGNGKPAPLVIGADSAAHDVLLAVPAEAALERFEMQAAGGRSIAYVGLTDTEFGGLVFVDGRLAGTVAKHDAQAFYSCRGYASATQHHWAMDATAWGESLVAAATPARSATLSFTGKSTYQSIKAVVDGPGVGQVRSLVEMGTNPLGILKSLNQARDSAKEREQHEQTLRALLQVKPGLEETRLAAIVKPEDVSFVAGGVVMAYPRYSMEFFVAQGQVMVMQQPSFHELSRQRAAMFYAPNAQWTRCTPQAWRSALP